MPFSNTIDDAELETWVRRTFPNKTHRDCKTKPRSDELRDLNSTHDEFIGLGTVKDTRRPVTTDEQYQAEFGEAI